MAKRKFKFPLLAISKNLKSLSILLLLGYSLFASHLLKYSSFANKQNFHSYSSFDPILHPNWMPRLPLATPTKMQVQ